MVWYRYSIETETKTGTRLRILYGADWAARFQRGRVIAIKMLVEAI